MGGEGGPVGFACDACGLSAAYAELLSFEQGRSKRTVRTAGCPNHYSHCTGKPGVAGCGAVSGEGTGTEAVATGRVFELPASPVLIAAPSDYTPLLCDLGPTGVALNGVPFFSAALDGHCAQLDQHASAFWESLDFCGGSVLSDGIYGYRVPPSCLHAQAEAARHSPGDGHSPQLGWALDGFPVYGPYGPGGRRMAHAEQGCAGPLCLDECGGLPMEHQLV
jgi:hypothetical protein